ncbi:MAG: hypothetical protein PHH01_02600 [Patescibacteria group bacterium]|nr:hypothetical protein [Patescibacteria group bacterium]
MKRLFVFCLVLTSVLLATTASGADRALVERTLVWVEGNPIPPDSTLNSSGYQWGVAQDSLITVNGFVAQIVHKPPVKAKVYADTPYGRMCKRAFAAAVSARDQGKNDWEAASAGAAVMENERSLVRSATVIEGGWEVEYTNGESESFELGQPKNSKPRTPQEKATSYQQVTDQGWTIVLAWNGEGRWFLTPASMVLWNEQILRVWDNEPNPPDPMPPQLMSLFRDPTPLNRESRKEE